MAYVDMLGPLPQRFCLSYLIHFSGRGSRRLQEFIPWSVKRGRSNSTEIPSTDLPGAIAAVTYIRPIKGDYMKGYTDLRWVSEFPT
jgi:hypothetical protein